MTPRSIQRASVLSILTVGAFAAGSTACGNVGSGVYAEQERILAKTAALEVRGDVDVQVTVDPSATDTRAAVLGDDNLLDHVITRVEGDKLVVEPNEIDAVKRGLLVRVTMPGFRAAELKGAADVSVTGVNGGTIEASTLSSGNLTLKGIAQRLELRVAGVGQTFADDLTTETALVTLEDRSIARVCASRIVSGIVRDSGTLTCMCNPQRIEVQTDGAGSIEHR